MSYLMSFFYDKVMKSTEEACLMDWRRELLKDIDGKVLEIGAGTGASLSLYPNSSNIELFLSEPDKNMRRQLSEKIKQSAKDNIHILNSSAEQIDSENDTYDFVFLSLVCCSVKDVNLTLSEIKRVLKPDGKFIFLEHVAAQTGTSRRKWQGRLNGIWRVFAGNCHLNRETEKSIIEAGFSIEQIKRESLRKAPSVVRPTIRGIASLT